MTEDLDSNPDSVEDDHEFRDYMTSYHCTDLVADRNEGSSNYHTSSFELGTKYVPLSDYYSSSSIILLHPPAFSCSFNLVFFILHLSLGPHLNIILLHHLSFLLHPPFSPPPSPTPSPLPSRFKYHPLTPLPSWNLLHTP